MKKIYQIVLGIILMFTISYALAEKPSGAAYIDGGNSKFGVILCHGRGKYPKWFVVNPLRIGINKELGYHTLSLQMPASYKDWQDYTEDFPEAYKRIQEGIDFLRKEKGIQTIYLIGHSMGSRMATAFLTDHTEANIAGFIGVGIRNGGDHPLDSNQNLRSISIPVLDIYGDGGNEKDADHAGKRADMVSNRYKQVLIAGANHKFTEHEKELVRVVVDWLKEQQEK